jgi:pre-mRNA-processing factor SLU7
MKMAEFKFKSLLGGSCLAVAFKSREDHRKQIELEEARKAGLAPAEVDEDGKEINPHIPQYMSSAPWYLNAEKPVSCLQLVFSFFFSSYASTCVKAEF